MGKKSLFILFGFMLFFSAGLSAQAGVIDPALAQLLQSIGPGAEVSVIVTLFAKADIDTIVASVSAFKDGEKGKLRSKLIKALKDKADQTQKPLIDFLKGKKAKQIIPFWIFNGLAVTATPAVIEELAYQPGIESIRLDDTFKMLEPVPAAESEPEWNINAIGAPELWNLGFTGAGTVVATMDTGVDADHPDLAAKWRGGSNSWYDPNGEHATPYDADGHGTQVTGVMVGGDAGATAIGVAPGAQWIAVKMYNDAGTSSYSVMHLGFQWLLDPDGSPDTNDSPDVVNNSWGFRGLIDQCFTEFAPDVQALKAAQIAVVFSAGNGGPYTSSSESPANYPESVAAGAVDDTMGIAYFSARGPSACDESIYPEVVAPGVNVRTADLTFGGMYPDSYTYATGTSIAAPHVSGAMALLLSAHPDATVAALEQALEDTALDLGTAGPDDSYGYGLIDAAAAEAWLANPPCTDEIKHDGIDQDCNGYDLTIDIIKADYKAKKDTLSVEATSDLGQQAGLELLGFGPMKWNRNKSKWTIFVRKAGGDPVTVTVSGIEGEETAPTDSGNQNVLRVD